jgi:adenylate cyclase class IV
LPRNIEIKAHLENYPWVRQVARSLATSPPRKEHQVDRYFLTDATGKERLKLRESDLHGFQLIRYRRPETTGIRGSDYQLEHLSGPEDPRLTTLSDPVLVVTKIRELIWVENVRVHLDQVEGLGNFLELEAVVDPEHHEVLCRHRINALLAAFEIESKQLLQASYSDLLEARKIA